MKEIRSSQRAFLRSLAQELSPVVMVGKEGYSEAVAKALDSALSDHELVKVRFQAHKDEVRAIAVQLAEATGSLLVSTTGFTAVFFRATKTEGRHWIDLEHMKVEL